jgi:hypothetical protein
LVQDGWLLRGGAGELVPQQPAEQVVVPEPAPLVVQGDQEQLAR